MAGHLDTRYKLTVKPRDPVKIDGHPVSLTEFLYNLSR